jgi:hypothetical protein
MGLGARGPEPRATADPSMMRQAIRPIRLRRPDQITQDGASAALPDQPTAASARRFIGPAPCSSGRSVRTETPDAVTATVCSN